MLQNIIKSAFRNLLKNKTSSVINIAGLSIGITCCLIAFLYVKQSLNFEDFHQNKDRIYRVTYSTEYPTGKNFNAHTPYPLATAMRNDFPELESICQLHEEVTKLISVGEERFEEEYLIFADSGFFDVFSYEVLAGDGKQALVAPNSVALTASTAKKYFGDENPIGKRIRFSDMFDLQVNALIADPPGNTHLRFGMIISWPMMKEYNMIGNDYEDWGWTWAGATYVTLPVAMETAAITDRFPALLEKYSPGNGNEPGRTEYYLQALTDIHFDEKYDSDNYSPTVSRARLWGIGLIALLVLITACINFTNLATAQASKRSREVGIRKVMGSTRMQLVRQFLGESTLITLVSISISLILAELSLPFVNELLESELTLGLLSAGGVGGFLGIVLVGVSLMAGFYPAMVISSYQPVWALKNHLHSYKSGGLSLRRSLVVVQFVISQVLILGTIVITTQLQYFQSKDLGFDKEAIVMFSLPDSEKGTLEVLENELKKNPAVRNVSFSSGPPTSNSRLNTTFVSKETDNPEEYQVELKLADDEYLQTFGLELLAGEWLRETTFDSLYGYVVNEALLRKIGITNPVEALGKLISPSINNGMPRPILGVVKDFHNESLHDEIKACILLNNDYYRHQGAIKMEGDSYGEVLASLEKNWEAAFPAHLFDYTFLDEQLAENYEEETRFQQAFQLFSFIAILIGCLGLYGLVSYMAVQRSKEIGIRKVLGASVQDIILLLSREFSILVLVAFAIAAPLAGIAMHYWLQDFAYRITLGPGSFLLTFLVAISIAWLTVGYKAWRSARRNPVDAIRTE